MSEELKTYEGVVTTIGDAEIGSTGNEKPRRIVIKKDLNEQYGKTFRIWSNHDDFGNLTLGQPIVVEYQEVPNRDPSRKPSNMIQAAWQESEGGANGTSAAHTSGAPTGTAPPSAATGWDDDDWGPPQTPGKTAGSTSAPTRDGGASGGSGQSASAPPATKWDDREAVVGVSWAIKCAIQALGPGCQIETVHQAAHRMLVLRDRIVSELRNS